MKMRRKEPSLNYERFVKSISQKGQKPVHISELSELESKLVKEALQCIEQQGKTPLYISGEQVFVSYVATLHPDSNIVPVKISENGNIEDLAPLLPFASENTRNKYLSMRRDYLSD